MLTHSFATIQEVSGSLPPTARFVIFPSATLGDLSSSEQLEHFQSLDIPGDFYVGAQSSEHSWFDFTSERLSFELYYDTTSDNLVFKNQGRLQLTLDALGPDDTEGPGNHQSVPPHSCVELSPGLWRVSDTDEEQAGLCDLLLMERRYSAKVIIPELEAAPVRRRKPRKAAQQVKQRIRLMKVNKVPTEKIARARSAIGKGGNPLHDVQPGAVITIKPPSGHYKYTEHNHTEHKSSSESYSIYNKQDIVITSATLVFRGYHSVFGSVAVKSLRQKRSPSLLATPMYAKRWEEEKRLLQDSNHRSIIKFIGADARFFSIYTEYLPHPDLAHLVKRPENYFRGSLKDARRIIREILSALKYLCDQEIMHNDIKPANILYDRKVKGAVLIDFGLASLGGTVRTGGTPWYVPPELIEKGERGFKGDVFALGVTALYLLGKCPLPELQSQGWKIANVEGSTEDTTKMRKWLRKVKKMQDGLSNSKLEQVVKAMLTREPLNRISAGKALDKLKE